jgi:hypothetical protein
MPTDMQFMNAGADALRTNDLGEVVASARSDRECELIVMGALTKLHGFSCGATSTAFVVEFLNTLALKVK